MPSLSLLEKAKWTPLPSQTYSLSSSISTNATSSWKEGYSISVWTSRAIKGLGMCMKHVCDAIAEVLERPGGTYHWFIWWSSHFYQFSVTWAGKNSLFRLAKSFITIAKKLRAFLEYVWTVSTQWARCVWAYCDWFGLQQQYSTGIRWVSYSPALNNALCALFLSWNCSDIFQKGTHFFFCYWQLWMILPV